MLGAWRYVRKDWPSTHAWEMASVVWARDSPLWKNVIYSVVGQVGRMHEDPYAQELGDDGS